MVEEDENEETRDGKMRMRTGTGIREKGNSKFTIYTVIRCNMTCIFCIHRRQLCMYNVQYVLNVLNVMYYVYDQSIEH